MAEMKIVGFPKSEQERENFDMDFEGIKELPAYVKLKDDHQLAVTHRPPRPDVSAPGLGDF